MFVAGSGLWRVMGVVMAAGLGVLGTGSVKDMDMAAGADLCRQDMA